MFVTIAVFGKAARLVKVPSLGRSVPHSWRMLGFSRLPDISSSNSAKLHVIFFSPSKNWYQGGHCWVTLSAALNMVRLTRIGWVFQKTGAGNEVISVGVRMSPRRCRKHWRLVSRWTWEDSVVWKFLEHSECYYYTNIYIYKCIYL